MRCQLCELDKLCNYCCYKDVYSSYCFTLYIIQMCTHLLLILSPGNWSVHQLQFHCSHQISQYIAQHIVQKICASENQFMCNVQHAIKAPTAIKMLLKICAFKYANYTICPQIKTQSINIRCISHLHTKKNPKQKQKKELKCSRLLEVLHLFFWGKWTCI